MALQQLDVQRASGNIKTLLAAHPFCSAAQDPAPRVCDDVFDGVVTAVQTQWPGTDVGVGFPQYLPICTNMDPPATTRCLHAGLTTTLYAGDSAAAMLSADRSATVHRNGSVTLSDARVTVAACTDKLSPLPPIPFAATELHAARVTQNEATLVWQPPTDGYILGNQLAGFRLVLYGNNQTQGAAVMRQNNISRDIFSQQELATMISAFPVLWTSPVLPAAQTNYSLGDLVPYAIYGVRLVSVGSHFSDQTWFTVITDQIAPITRPTVLTVEHFEETNLLVRWSDALFYEFTQLTINLVDVLTGLDVSTTTLLPGKNTWDVSNVLLQRVALLHVHLVCNRAYNLTVQIQTASGRGPVSLPFTFQSAPHVVADAPSPSVECGPHTGCTFAWALTRAQVSKGTLLKFELGDCCVDSSYNDVSELHDYSSANCTVYATCNASCNALTLPAMPDGPVCLRVRNSAGLGPWSSPVVQAQSTTQTQSAMLYVAVAVPISLLLLLGLLIVCYRRRGAQDVAFSLPDKDIWWDTERSVLSNMTKLNDGLFGEIFVANWRPQDGSCDRRTEGDQVCVKVCRMDTRNANKREFINEIAVMKRITLQGNINVMALLKTDFTQEPLLAITEYCALGPLDVWLKQQSREMITTGQLVALCTQVANGTQFLVSNDVYHRALMASNCLLTSECVVKINGYGITRRHSDTSAFNENRSEIRWKSPECICRGHHDENTVVWSLGVTFWEIFSMGAIPLGLNTNGEAFRLIATNKVSFGCPVDCPPRAYEIMKSTWRPTPKRPSTEEVFNDMLALEQEIQEQQGPGPFKRGQQLRRSVSQAPTPVLLSASEKHSTGSTHGNPALPTIHHAAVASRTSAPLPHLGSALELESNEDATHYSPSFRHRSHTQPMPHLRHSAGSVPLASTPPLLDPVADLEHDEDEPPPMPPPVTTAVHQARARAATMADPLNFLAARAVLDRKTKTSHSFHRKRASPMEARSSTPPVSAPVQVTASPRSRTMSTSNDELLEAAAKDLAKEETQLRIREMRQSLRHSLRHTKARQQRQRQQRQQLQGHERNSSRHSSVTARSSEDIKPGLDTAGSVQSFSTATGAVLGDSRPTSIHSYSGNLMDLTDEKRLTLASRRNSTILASSLSMLENATAQAAGPEPHGTPAIRVQRGSADSSNAAAKAPEPEPPAEVLNVSSEAPTEPSRPASPDLGPYSPVQQPSEPGAILFDCFDTGGGDSDTSGDRAQLNRRGSLLNLRTPVNPGGANVLEDASEATSIDAGQPEPQTTPTGHSSVLDVTGVSDADVPASAASSPDSTTMDDIAGLIDQVDQATSERYNTSSRASSRTGSCVFRPGRKSTSSGTLSLAEARSRGSVADGVGDLPRRAKRPTCDTLVSQGSLMSATFAVVEIPDVAFDVLPSRLSSSLSQPASVDSDSAWGSAIVGTLLPTRLSGAPDEREEDEQDLDEELLDSRKHSLSDATIYHEVEGVTEEATDVEVDKQPSPGSVAMSECIGGLAAQALNPAPKHQDKTEEEETQEEQPGPAAPACGVIIRAPSVARVADAPTETAGHQSAAEESETASPAKPADDAPALPRLRARLPLTSELLQLMQPTGTTVVVDSPTTTSRLSILSENTEHSSMFEADNDDTGADSADELQVPASRVASRTPSPALRRRKRSSTHTPTGASSSDEDENDMIVLLQQTMDETNRMRPLMREASRRSPARRSINRTPVEKSSLSQSTGTTPVPPTSPRPAEPCPPRPAAAESPAAANAAPAADAGLTVSTSVSGVSDDEIAPPKPSLPESSLAAAPAPAGAPRSPIAFDITGRTNLLTNPRLSSPLPRASNSARRSVNSRSPGVSDNPYGIEGASPTTPKRHRRLSSGTSGVVDAAAAKQS